MYTGDGIFCFACMALVDDSHLSGGRLLSMGCIADKDNFNFFFLIALLPPPHIECETLERCNTGPRLPRDLFGNSWCAKSSESASADPDGPSGLGGLRSPLIFCSSWADWSRICNLTSSMLLNGEISRLASLARVSAWILPSILQAPAE